MNDFQKRLKDLRTEYTQTKDDLLSKSTPLSDTEKKYIDFLVTAIKGIDDTLACMDYGKSLNEP